MKVERMLNLAEYKRRQAAPGVKVTLRNFGRDRRYPITPLPRSRHAAAATGSLAAYGLAGGQQRGV
jgi:NAD+ synthase